MCTINYLEIMDEMLSMVHSGMISAEDSANHGFMLSELEGLEDSNAEIVVTNSEVTLS
jgi:hypothetical protein